MGCYWIPFWFIDIFIFLLHQGLINYYYYCYLALCSVFVCGGAGPLPGLLRKAHLANVHLSCSVCDSGTPISVVVVPLAILQSQGING